MKRQLRITPITRMGVVVIAILCHSFGFTQVGQDVAEQPVIAKGIGAIFSNDQAKAQDDALGNALRNAVEQVVGTMIQSEVLVENYQVMEDRIYARTDGFVKSYEVINSQQQGNDIWETTIKAVVSKSALENDLAAAGILMARKGKPRIMVLIEEVNMGHHYYAHYTDLGTTETELVSQLAAKGYTFVDRKTVSQKLNRDAITAAISGDASMAQSIAQESGAEVLVVGSAASKSSTAAPPALRQAGMISAQATVNLRVVRADDGTIIATTSQNAPAAHIDNMTGGQMALKKATGMAAEELNRQILSAWQQDVYSGTTVQLRLIEVPTFNDFVQVKSLIQFSVRGVSNVYQRSFSSGSGVLDVEVKGSAAHVAEELATKDFSPYKIEITSITQNAIVAKLLINSSTGG